MRTALLLSVLALAAGCRDTFQAGCPDGAEGCACAADGQCFGGLVCASNTCIDPNSVTGTGTDSSTSSSSTSTSDSTSSVGTTTGTSDTSLDTSSSASSTSGTTNATASGGSTGTATDCDEFDGNELDACWSVLNPQLSSVNVTAGELVLRPTQHTQWYQASQAILVHRPVTGDFALEAQITVTGGDGTSDPALAIRLGGLMLRDPQGPDENYVAWLLGAAQNEVGLEWKTTTNSVTQLGSFPLSPTSARVRLCRVAGQIGYATFDANQWVEWRQEDRPDLPDELQGGVVAYSSNAEPDLEVRVDYVRTTGLNTLAECWL